MIRKRYIKGEKHIAPMDFAEYLRKPDVSEKVYYGQFLRNRLVILVKVDEMYKDEMYNILKSASHCSLVGRSRWN